MSQKQKKTGKPAFEEYYAALYGERWPILKEALAAKPAHISCQTGLLKPYFLDAGSLLAACALPLTGANRILDMCAAPGGKSLVLATRMDGNTLLCANERSLERRLRLLRVLDGHLPPSLRERVTVCGSDAARWCRYERNVFDRILLDAPCSSERHVLADKKYLDQWTAARIKNLAAAQWALLSSAFLVLKPGGKLLYATCALSPAENDGVVSRLFSKYDNAALELPELKLLQAEFLRAAQGRPCSAEKTEYGWHVLPDRENGAGPLFFSLITKSELDKKLS